MTHIVASTSSQALHFQSTPHENPLIFNVNDSRFIKHFCAQPFTDFELYNQFAMNPKVLLK